MFAWCKRYQTSCESKLHNPCFKHSLRRSLFGEPTCSRTCTPNTSCPLKASREITDTKRMHTNKTSLTCFERAMLVCWKCSKISLVNWGLWLSCRSTLCHWLAQLIQTWYSLLISYLIQTALGCIEHQGSRRHMIGPRSTCMNFKTFGKKYRKDVWDQLLPQRKKFVKTGETLKEHYLVLP